MKAHTPSLATTPPDEAQAVLHILAHCRTVAVVGLSPDPQRASFDVSRYMQAQGWRIIPVNPPATTVLGEKAYPTLGEAARHVHIDLVNVFRNSADVPPVADEAIAIGAKALWLQQGIRHDGAAAMCRAAGMLVVQDKCLMVEHLRQAK
jgi:predicted CoA-binding protein